MINASFNNIDYLIRRSTEGPDNPITVLIGFFVAVYAIAGLVLLCAGLYGVWKGK